MTTITREQAQAVSDLKAGYTLGHADVAILKDLARIALASLTAEPALYAAEETLAYANMGELHLTCLSEPMGDAVIPLYAAPPVPVVPAALPENDDEDGHDIDYLEPSEVYALGRTAGWNACRAAMLQGAEHVSNRDELPVIGWLRSDYNSDDKRDPNAPLFMLGSNDPSEAWGVKYIPLSGNSPVIPDGWVMVPVDMTPEQMRAVQIKSELGSYAAANLSGAYALFREFWDVSVAAAPKQEAE